MSTYRNKLRIVIAIDTFLVVVILLGLLFSPGSANSRATSFNLIESVDSTVTIEIQGPDALKLVRGDGGWIMDSSDGMLPADSARIDSFLKAVDSVSHLEPVAKDKASWSDLGLEGAETRRVTLTDSKGAIMCDFLLGKYASSPDAVYFALADGPESYSVASGMASYVLGKRSSWLDLRMWTSPPSADSVQQLIVNGVSEGTDGIMQPLVYTVTRAGAGWVSDGIALDGAKMEALVRSLATLRGEDYASSTEPSGQVVTTVELRLGNGRSLSIALGEKGQDGRYPALSSQRNRRMYLPSWALTEVLKPLDQLKATVDS